MLTEFWNTVQQCGVQWPMCTWRYCTNHAITIAKFLTGNVLDYNLIDQRTSVALCILYKVGSNPMHCFRGEHPEQYVPVRVIHVVLWCLIGILIRFLVAEFHTTAEHLFLCVYRNEITSAPCVRWCGTTGEQLSPLLFIFSTSLLSFYRLVVWGWCLMTNYQ